MTHESRWVTDDNVALLTDQYELTMVQAYWREGMERSATFSLFVRRLPATRNYLLACGLEDALRYMETLSFRTHSLEYLATLGIFSDGFLRWLAEFRFTGDVYAVAEGTPVFAEEPILEVVAPLPEAQLVETFLMNQIHLQTVVASKARRVVEAARGRAVVDFGLRRMHGTDAGIKAARAFHIAGVESTSNVLAGFLYDIPVSGTMAHSYVQAHESDLTAFRAFAELYPETILLVDTYDSLDGVRAVLRLAAELGDDFRIRGIRLDSGDLGSLAYEARRLLDEAGLTGVEIFASGGLDEREIAGLVDRGTPITGFGVGTGMGVSADAPGLDMAYKLTSYAGAGRLKLSPGKRILPGRKQVYRIERDGRAVRDVIARAEEHHTGRPILRRVMARGRRLPQASPTLEQIRRTASEEIERLPDRIRALEPADPRYPVEISAELEAYRVAVAHAVAEG